MERVAHLCVVECVSFPLGLERQLIHSLSALFNKRIARP